jgi:hypothetical protein
VLLHPIADDHLALAPLIALFPFRVNIGSINKISPMHGVGVQDVEGLGLVRAPAKDVAAEAKWVNGEGGLRDSDHCPTVRQD